MKLRSTRAPVGVRLVGKDGRRTSGGLVKRTGVVVTGCGSLTTRVGVATVDDGLAGRRVGAEEVEAVVVMVELVDASME